MVRFETLGAYARRKIAAIAAVGLVLGTFAAVLAPAAAQAAKPPAPSCTVTVNGDGTTSATVTGTAVIPKGGSAILSVSQPYGAGTDTITSTTSGTIGNLGPYTTATPNPSETAYSASCFVFDRRGNTDASAGPVIFAIAASWDVTLVDHDGDGFGDTLLDYTVTTNDTHIAYDVVLIWESNGNERDVLATNVTGSSSGNSAQLGGHGGYPQGSYVHIEIDATGTTNVIATSPTLLVQ